jgi:uncharacterized membrane protein
MSDIEVLRKKSHNVNHKHREGLSFNDKIALKITALVGSMIAAYVFAIIAFVGFPFHGATPLQYVLWLSSEFLQLVLLPIIIVGQNLQSKHSSLMAEQQYQLVKKLDSLLEDKNKKRKRKKKVPESREDWDTHNFNRSTASYGLEGKWNG